MSTNSSEKSDSQKDEQSEAIPVAIPLDGELTAELLTAKNFLGYGYNRSRKTIEQEVWSMDDSHVRIGHREHIKAYAVDIDERESFGKLSTKYTFLSDPTIPVKNR